MDSRLRGNDRVKGTSLFLVTPLRGVTFFLALCAISKMADQYPGRYNRLWSGHRQSCLLRIGGNHKKTASPSGDAV
jgi:hypothetical protein